MSVVVTCRSRVVGSRSTGYVPRRSLARRRHSGLTSTVVRRCGLDEAELGCVAEVTDRLVEHADQLDPAGLQGHDPVAGGKGGDPVGHDHQRDPAP
jgi:hypothetical protein